MSLQLGVKDDRIRLLAYDFTKVRGKINYVTEDIDFGGKNGEQIYIVHSVPTCSLKIQGVVGNVNADCLIVICTEMKGDIMLMIDVPLGGAYRQKSMGPKWSPGGHHRRQLQRRRRNAQMRLGMCCALDKIFTRAMLSH